LGYLVYIPPTENSVYGSVDIFDEIVEKLDHVTVNKNYQVCLLGDFNAHTGTHDDYYCKRYNPAQSAD
jgi:hypothetical protein